MPNLDFNMKVQPSLIDELLASQDEVIRELDSLEQRILKTIEEIRPAKQEEQGPSTDAAVEQICDDNALPKAA